MFEPAPLPGKPRHRLRRFAALKFCAVAAIWFCLAASLHAAATFTVSLDRNIITLGEGAILSLTFENGDPARLPAPPAIPNLNFSSPYGQSAQSATIINGQVSTSVIYACTVTPSQPGAYTIPALTVQVGNETLTSQPVKLMVLKPGVVTPSPPENKTAFLRVLIPKTNLFLGEVLPVEIQVLFQMAQGGEPPHLKEEGFTLGKLVQGAQSQTVVNGQRYNLFPIHTFVVPAKVGNLELGPATMSLKIPLPNSRRNVFGELVDWQTVTLQSDPQTLQVAPLPSENVPPTFNGAVGNFTLTLSASPTNIAVGDPLTVTVQIAGQGAADFLTLPPQTNWEHFKLYPPTSDFQPSDQLGAAGAKVFKLTAVPESTDIRELPPFSFSFFDPDTKAYRTLTQPAVPLIVRPSAASLPPPSLAGANNSDNPPAPQDIAPIKPRLGVVAQIQPPLIARPWFIAAQGVPVAAWLALLLLRRQKERLAGNPRLRRQREAERALRAGRQELRQAAAANQPGEFFAALFHLLQEQLGERLDLPASAITESIVDERLRPLGVPEATLDELSELFQACNQARYAQTSTGEALASLIPRTEAVLGELKNLKT